MTPEAKDDLRVFLNAAAGEGLVLEDIDAADLYHAVFPFPPQGEYRAGALAYQGDDDEWIITNPNDPMYSTTTMAATHHWDAESDAWKEV